jgi:hypothetical protein
MLIVVMIKRTSFFIFGEFIDGLKVAKLIHKKIYSAVWLSFSVKVL